MPRRAPARYQMGADGEMHRTWNGKLPEEFSERDALFFLADTDIALHGKVSADTLAAIYARAMTIRAGPSYPGPERRTL